MKLLIECNHNDYHKTLFNHSDNERKHYNDDEQDDDDDDDNNLFSSTDSDSIINEQERAKRTASAPTDDRVKAILLIDIKHRCIAEQLTIIMHDVYRKIPFNSIQINKTNYYTNSYIKIFNQIVIWVQYSILVAINSKQRAKIIKKWIKCCDHLLSMRNYHGLVAVHCALQSNCVYSGKLKIAWFKYKRIIKKKHHQYLKKISNIVSYNDNYHELRNRMKNERYPLLPYWGIFKRDCVYANEFKHNNDNKKSENMIKSMLKQYNKFKEGEYEIKLKHDSLIETWIHYQLGETGLINISAINRMSDGVRDLDQKHETPSNKRRYSIL